MTVTGSFSFLFMLNNKVSCSKLKRRQNSANILEVEKILKEDEEKNMNKLISSELTKSIKKINNFFLKKE